MSALLPAPAARTVRRQRIFPSSGSWTCPTGVTAADVLIVSGGGAGFWISGSVNNASGGGGGGVAVRTGVAVTPGTAYPVIVGSGGAKAASNTFSGSGTFSQALGTTVSGGSRAEVNAGDTATPGTFGNGFGNGSPGVDTPWGRFANGGRRGGAFEGGNGFAQAGDTGSPPTPGANSGHGGNTPVNTTQQATAGASGIVIIEWEEAA